MNVGDTVRLKSGGPLMTVKDVYDKTVDVIWFPGHEEVVAREGTFPTACVEHDTHPWKVKKSA